MPIVGSPYLRFLGCWTEGSWTPRGRGAECWTGAPPYCSECVAPLLWANFLPGVRPWRRGGGDVWVGSHPI